MNIVATRSMEQLGRFVVNKLKAQMPGVLLVSILTAGLPATAQTPTWSVDPNHSSAQFTVRHMGLSNVSGTFNKVSGTAQLDDSNWTKSSEDAVIDVASVDTRVDGRDKDLRSPNFFDAEKYPTMEFKSKSVQKNGDGLKLIGDLIMHGVTKEVTLNLDVPGAAVTDPWGNARRGFSASTMINRKDWGLIWNNTLKTGEAVVGDIVKIEINVELVKTK
jgi:polyisoprenoid-binding protein YceI